MQDAAQVAFDRLAAEREVSADTLGEAIATSDKPIGDPVHIADYAWKQWLEATSFLQHLGVAPRAMCDAVNTVQETRSDIADREHQTA